VSAHKPISTPEDAKQTNDNNKTKYNQKISKKGKPSVSNVSQPHPKLTEEKQTLVDTIANNLDPLK
jgi:hypothetical protein